MIAALRMGRLRPMVRRRAFGLIKTDWPRCRCGGRGTPGPGRRGPRPERVLRGRRAARAAPPAAAGPVELPVARISLAPRFELIWQNFVQVARAFAAPGERAAIDRALPAAGTASQPRAVAESLIARTERVFLGRMALPPPLERQARRRPVASPTGGWAAVETRPIRLGVTRGPDHRPIGLIASRRADRALRMVTRRSFDPARTPLIARPQPDAQLRFRSEILLSTTVSQRVVRHMIGSGSVLRSMSGTATAAAAPIGPTLAAPANRVDAPSGPVTLPAERGFRAGDPPRPEVASAEPPRPFAHVPTERRLRTSEAPARASVPTAPPPRPTTPQPAPDIDIARLDRTLWQRFEKRLRIEQERSGRR